MGGRASRLVLASLRLDLRATKSRIPTRRARLPTARVCSDISNWIAMNDPIWYATSSHIPTRRARLLTGRHRDRHSDPRHPSPFNLVRSHIPAPSGDGPSGLLQSPKVIIDEEEYGDRDPCSGRQRVPRGFPTGLIIQLNTERLLVYRSTP